MTLSSAKARRINEYVSHAWHMYYQGSVLLLKSAPGLTERFFLAGFPLFPELWAAVTGRRDSFSGRCLRHLCLPQIMQGVQRI
jgi:hypothetical protein